MTEFDPAQLLPAARIGGRATLTNIRVWDVRARLSPDMPEQLPTVEVRTAVEAEAAVGQDGTTFQGQIRYAVTGHIPAPPSGDDENAESAPDETIEILTIEILWILDYDLPEDHGFPESALQDFVEVSSTFAVHPYMREAVQTLTLRMGLPPLILDLLRSPLDVAASQPSTLPEGDEDDGETLAQG